MTTLKQPIQLEMSSHWRHASLIVTAEEIDAVKDALTRESDNRAERLAIDADEARLAAATRSLHASDWRDLEDDDDGELGLPQLTSRPPSSSTPTSESGERSRFISIRDGATSPVRRPVRLTEEEVEEEEEPAATTRAAAGASPAALLVHAEMLFSPSITDSASARTRGGADLPLPGDVFTLSQPSCIIALPTGMLCVADTAADRLLVIDPDLRAVRSIIYAADARANALSPAEDPHHPSQPSARGQSAQGLRQPRGLACDGASLLVSEVGGRGRHLRGLTLPDELKQQSAPQQATPSLHLECQPAAEAAQPLTFPQGIAVCQGEIFVCDCEEHQVFVFDAQTLSYLRGFGSYGDAEGELHFPYSVTVIGEEVPFAFALRCASRSTRSLSR